VTRRNSTSNRGTLIRLLWLLIRELEARRPEGVGSKVLATTMKTFVRNDAQKKLQWREGVCDIVIARTIVHLWNLYLLSHSCHLKAIRRHNSMVEAFVCDRLFYMCSFTFKVYFFFDISYTFFCFESLYVIRHLFP
jgi:hypothetical protein